MTSPFDVIWSAIIEKGEGNFPADDNEAAKVALKLLASALVSSPIKAQGRIDKNIQTAAQAARAAVIAAENKSFFDALELCNDTIRFCPDDSAELSTFFRNRSEILLHLNEKEASESDIRRSVHKISNNSKADIQDQPAPNKNTGRKSRDEFKVNTNKNSRNFCKKKSIINSGEENIPTLTAAGKQSQLKYASQFVRLKTDSERGRHLFAAEEIPPGTCVGNTNAFIWEESRESDAFSMVMFCDESCRDRCMEDFHRAECPVVQLLVQGKHLTPMALLVFRTVMKGSNLSAALGGTNSLILNEEFLQLHQKPVQQKPTEIYQSDYRAAFLQVTNSESRSSGDRLKRAVTAAYLTECLDIAIGSNTRYKNEHLKLSDDHKVLLTSAFFHHLQSSSCNAYQVMQQVVRNGDIRQSEGQDIGGAVYPTIALLNHSCAPNVARHTHGSTCVVRATRKIQTGEEILDNYGPHHLSTEDVNERRRYLRLHYFFECNCEACTGKWPSAGVLRSQPARIICGSCRGLVGQANSPEMLKSLQKCPLCRRKNNFTRLMTSWREFEDSLQTLLSGDTKRALTSSLRLLNTMNSCVQQPSNVQARATQVATLLWSLKGNRTDRQNSIT